MTSHPLTQQELDHLAEIREVCQTANTAGYRLILAQMETWAAEALEAIRSAPYASNEVKAAMQMRWSQRDSILQGVKQYVQGCQDEKDMLLEEARQKERSSNAERNQDVREWQDFSEVGNW